MRKQLATGALMLSCVACHAQQKPTPPQVEQPPQFTKEQKQKIVDAMQVDVLVQEVCKPPKWRFAMVTKPKADGTGTESEPGCIPAPPPQAGDIQGNPKK